MSSLDQIQDRELPQVLESLHCLKNEVIWHLEVEQRNPTLHCALVRLDDVPSTRIEQIWLATLQVYEPTKQWRQLRREGTYVGRCTV